MPEQLSGKDGTMYRAWINQPSTLQPLHDLHGVKVLADDDCRLVDHADVKNTSVYFLSGPVVSMFVPDGTLSKGWH